MLLLFIVSLATTQILGFNQDFQMLLCLPGKCICGGDMTWHSKAEETAGQYFREPFKQAYCMCVWVLINAHIYMCVSTCMHVWHREENGELKFLIGVDQSVLDI